MDTRCDLFHFRGHKLAPKCRLITTGGTITTNAWDKIHTFTTSGTFTCVGAGYIQLLIVGGGQGGNYGYQSSGFGGNGGEVKLYPVFKINSGSYTITIGNKSNGGSTSTSTPPSAAGNSSAFSITAFGGDRTNGRGTYGAGGISSGSGYPGSNGTTSDISGSSYVYASSGGSGSKNIGSSGNYPGGSGGTGAGNGGGITLGITLTAATTGSNYGAGGGGGSCNYSYSKFGNGAAGADGIVIIRFRRI